MQKLFIVLMFPQGNYLEAATVAQVKPGMTTQQVQYLLGTPVLIDPYSNLTWITSSYNNTLTKNLNSITFTGEIRSKRSSK